MKKLLFTLGLGAGAMYFFDPELGEIRRSMLADKLSGKLPKTADAFAAKADALGAKVENVAAKADELVAEHIEHVGPTSDEVLVERIENESKSA